MKGTAKTSSIISYLYWFLPPVLLSLFTFLVYWPTLRYAFVFDDFPTIIEYIHARTFSPWNVFFRCSRWLSRILNQYTFSRWQDNPFAYRIFDVILHIVIGVMIFAFVAKLLSNVKKNVFLQQYAYPLAILVSGLFLLHPVQTQTATYITQMRLEGLVVFFVFAVLLSYLYATRATSIAAKWVLYGLTFVLAAFATGTKEIIITLPVLVVLVDWFFIAEGDWQDFKTRLWVHGGLTFIVVWFLSHYGAAQVKNIVAAATTPVHNNRGNTITAQPTEFITTGVFFISQFKVILHYLGIFFWPFGLCFDYGYKLARGFWEFDVIVPLITLCTLIGGSVYLFIKNQTNIVSFAFAWFFLTMLPRTSIFPGTELICDYKTYIASFGVLFLIAVGLLHAAIFLFNAAKRLYGYNFAFVHYALAVTLFIGMLGGATKMRNDVWCTEESFWKDVIDKNPQDARAWNNYAVALNIKGDEPNAIKSFEQAITVDGLYAEPHINLATIYHMHGARDKAYAHYTRALEIGEAHPELFNNLGMFHREEGGLAQAEHCFREAVTIRPSFSRAWKNLGDLYMQTNKVAQAEDCYNHALQGDAVDDELVYIHSVANCALGRPDKALANLEQLAAKNYRDAAFYLGSAYFGMRRYADACKHLKVMYEKQPNVNAYAYNYALALLNVGRSAEALPLFDQCRKNEQEHPYAGLHYGRCLFETGKKEEAKKQLTALLRSSKEDFVRKDVVLYLKEVKLA